MSKIITRHELLTGGWLDSVKMLDNEATEEEYHNLVSFMAGSGFITHSSQQHSFKDDTIVRIIGGTQEGCVGGEKINLLGLPSFIDLQGQPLGRIKNILFFNREQNNMFRWIMEDHHTALGGPYGGGKTSLLVSSAITEADHNDSDVVFIIGAGHSDVFS